ncbi:zinc-binding dehydrogenase [Micropruina sonneratiae]|uniref:zinc-binding dehydrogenase n=1 Tax=Micropruina sonneratiae TaxID=2986940 RepID=UPI0022269977|nr:zinc-binding dehydrogenase [Micropruina sp. KQZ13P-5]MCW3156492.1 zinc-binding dehydrogenase [Micropruina sp. KQZ13P-5]
MLAAYVESADRTEPLAALRVGERPEPQPAEGWAVVEVEAASLNRHDLWSLAGVGLPAERMPMILGTDAAGRVGDRPVIVHAVIASDGWSGDETLDPKRTLLSELHQGTMAGFVTVPERNLVDRPDWLSAEQASCLPTAWLTAYRMLTHDSGLSAGDTVLIQGASGGVASAATVLAGALGLRAWVTGSSEAKRAAALERGADAAFEPGTRLPERVDAVIETVGEATWAHSLRSLRPGGTIVCAGATSGFNPPAELNRVFFQQLRVIGSTMGTIEEFGGLLALLERTGVRPVIDRVLPLADAAEGFAAMAQGTLDGKIVIRP